MKTNGNNQPETIWPNGKKPHWTDYKNPKRLTKDQKALIQAFREAMAALKEEEAKYGKKDYSNL